MADPLEKSRVNENAASNASSDDRDVAAESPPTPTKTEEPKPKGPSKLKQWWAKLGLTPPLLMAMAKGALPPTIGIAMYEASSVARIYTTVGYLIAIISILSLSILPRAKFMQNLLLATIGTCVGASLALLGIYCAIKARENTTPANPTKLQLLGYNSSENAICALWLILNIWLSNTLRASRPALQIPVIIYSIFISVSMTSAPRFPTMALGQKFIRRLLLTFLTGFGLGAGVAWFIIPVSCRMVVFKEMEGYVGLLQGALKAQTSYMKSLKGTNIVGVESQENGADSHGHGRGHKKKNAPTGLKSSPEALKLKATMQALGELHGKLHGDIPYAKRELAYGNFSGKDLDDMYHHLRAILLPLLGMSTLADIFDRLYEARGWGANAGKNADGSNTLKDSGGFAIPDSEVKKATENWDLILGAMRKPFEHLSDAMVEALEHATLTLQLKKAPKKKKGDPKGPEQDIEANGGAVKPGTKEFSAHFETRTRDVYQQMVEALKGWTTAEREALEETERLAREGRLGDAEQIKRWERKEQQQLFLVLYMEHLFYSAAASILDFVKYADGKVEDGTMKRKRIVYPDYAHLKKWLHSIFKTEDGTVDLNNPDSAESGSHSVYEGNPLKKHDPEHLPPKNNWQRFGNSLRSISHFLGSSESAFGLRVAAATMSVGIVAFLHNSQNFFYKQRLVWAMVIIAIGMTPTSGSATFGFIGRILGTTLAMVNSYINWYIVDGHRAGVIVFLYIFIFLELYVVLKFPRLIQISVLMIVTQVLIVGYELQVKRLGKKVATSNGQPYYPIYTLAPYRLATVAAGSLISWFWTIFPNPITDRSQIRKDLGKALFLLANFYSCVHTSVEIWLSGTQGDLDDKHSPGRKLEKLRYKLFGKEMLLLLGLRQHSAFTKFEPTVGGKFPKKTYDDIIQETQNILQYMALISYATRSIQPTSSAHTIAQPPDTALPDDPISSNDPNAKSSNHQSQWLRDLADLTKSIDVTSHSITALLALLSASVSNGHALPPYLEPPKPYNLVETLEAVDRDILSIKHIEEPGYSAFAVMEVCSNMISDDLGRLLKNVKTLVGEVDFAYHILSTSQGSSRNQSSSSFLTQSSDRTGKGKRD